MPTFNNDVRIVESDLILENAVEEEIVRVDQGGNITVRHADGGVLADALSFDPATSRVRLGSVGSAGDLALAGTGGDDTVQLVGADARLTLGASGANGDLMIVNG